MPSSVTVPPLPNLFHPIYALKYPHALNNSQRAAEDTAREGMYGLLVSYAKHPKNKKFIFLRTNLRVGVAVFGIWVGGSSHDGITISKRRVEFLLFYLRESAGFGNTYANFS